MTVLAYEVVDPEAMSKPVICKVLYDFTAERPEEISIKHGEIISSSVSLLFSH